MELEYLASSYAANQVESIPGILKQKGYESGFFHGATNGSMNFDVFADVSNFDQYYGRTEYNNDKDFDGTWGIFDDKFCTWAVNQFSEMKKPFFSTLFTLSSHHPFTIPDEFGDRFSKGPALINDAVRYSDYALQQFFKAAEEKDWYDNTLFIIVADHTPASGTPIYFKEMGNMHIPLVFYHPTNQFFKGRSEKVVSQIDIMPTILDLVGHHDPFFSFGNSVFQDQDGQSASFIGEKFLYFGTYKNEHYLLTYLDEKPLGLYNLKDKLQSKNLLDLIEVTENLEDRLQALIQTYNHALINNQMLIRNQ
jgi:phosphoglycerol transferase MdoB-like AlkP superfamily enzyme